MTDKITSAEMVEMFGEEMPIEAVNLIWNSPGAMTCGEARAKLREIAANRPTPMTDPLPIERAGMAELTKDHIGQREATERDWNSLTFGEQHEYETRACRTAGAVYSSKLSERSVHMTVELPESLAFKGLTEDDAKRLERNIHRAVESAIVWFIKWREMGRP